MGIEVIYLNIMKTIYDKPTANIVLSDEKLKAFLLRSGKDKGAHTDHYYSYNMFSNSWLWLLEKKKKEKRSRLEKK